MATLVKISPKAVIAGGGPVGATAAIMLAQQGWSVQVFEKASMPPSRPSQHDQRSYTLTMTSRAIRVFKLASVSLKPIIASQGGRVEVQAFDTNGKSVRNTSIPVTDEPVILRAFRDEVTRCVVEEAKRLHPAAITFHFNSRIRGVDLHRQVPYDLLIGADGAGSVVRKALQQIMPPNFVRRFRNEQVYSIASVTVADPSEIPQHVVFTLHPLKAGAILWDGRGSQDCRACLVLPIEQAEAVRRGEVESTLAMIKSSAPKLPEYGRAAIVDMLQSKPEFFPMPGWTHLTQFHGPKTVLLGDAAHCMSPVLGQGLNSGLEDVAIFAECLQQHAGQVDTALPAYTAARMPDIRAIMTINEVAASQDIGLAPQDQGIAHKLWLYVHGFLLGVHMASHTLLHKAAPHVFAEPRMMPMVMGHIPYRKVTAAMYWDGSVVAGITFCVAAYILQWLKG